MLICPTVYFKMKRDEMHPSARKVRQYGHKSRAANQGCQIYFCQGLNLVQKRAKF